MGVKNQLVNLITKGEWMNLVDFILSYVRGKLKVGPEVEEALCEMSTAEQDLVWKSITKFMEESASLMRKDIDEDSISSDKETESEDILKSLLVLATLQTNAMIDEKNKHLSPPSPELVSLIVLIGSHLGHLNASIHEIVLDLCKKWTLNELDRADELLPIVFLEVVKICLSPNGKKQDIKHLWCLKKGLFDLLNQNTNDNVLDETLKELLVSFCSSSLALSCDEGVKLASLFFCNPLLTSSVHKAIKESLPDATLSQSEKYSQVYFRTWKMCEDPLKKKFEENCIQDLMYLAVHADHRASLLSRNLNCFLHQFHKYKKHPQTASVIYSLYEPFIWCSLKVANGYVRTNAATLLCDLFPCSDVSLSQEEKEDLMNQQYQAFITLLTDSCQLVRIATTKGVFSILNDFWLMIPPNIIQKMFQIFIGQLIVDASSAEIRRLVVQGITQMLDNPEAGPFMKDILPHAAGAFDDVNSSVRIAFMKLLLRVKATRFIKYWKLVPMEHILNRLAEDNSSVRTLIVELIQSSFLPFHLDDQEMFHRCISLIETNRGSARRFYQLASKKFDLEASTRFILFIWRSLLRYIHVKNSSHTLNSSHSGDSGNDVSNNSSQDVVQPSRKKKAKARKSQNKENESGNSETSEMPLDNPDVVCGLLDTIIILWTMNAPNLGMPENLKYLDALRSKVSRTFPTVWIFFKENDDISKTLLYMASFLPPSHVSTMVGLCLSRLKAIDEKEAPIDDFRTYLNAICNWNRIGDIIDIISDWLVSAFRTASVLDVSNSNKKSAKFPRVRFEEESKPKPLLALRFLFHILDHPLNKRSLLQTNKKLLIALCEKMGEIQNLIEKRFKSCEKLVSVTCSDEFLLSCWSDYLCIVSLLHHIPPPDPEEEEEGEEDPRRCTRKASRSNASLGEDVEPFDGLRLHLEYIQWMDRFVIEDGVLDIDFFYSCVSRLLKAGSDFIAIGFADDDYLEHYLKFCRESLIKAPFNFSLCRSALMGISNCHNHYSTYSSSAEYLSPLTSGPYQTLSVLLDAFEKEERCGETDNVGNLAEVMKFTFLELSKTSKELSKSISRRLVYVTLKNLSNELKSDPLNINKMNHLKDLGERTFTLVSSVHKNTQLAHAFVLAMIEGFGIDINYIQIMLAAVVLLSVFFNDGGKIPRQDLKLGVTKFHQFMSDLVPPQSKPESEDISENFIFKEHYSCYETLNSKLQELLEYC